jgi:outer membrane protein OmpA-like peptidoglycan-associated protein
MTFPLMNYSINTSQSTRSTNRSRWFLHCVMYVAVLVLTVSLGLFVSACKTTKSVEEQLASADLERDSKKEKKLYLTGTRPASAISDTTKLAYDIWKTESNDYPREIRLYARVFDSTGNFITHLAPPVHPNQDYWVSLSERLGRKTISIDSFTVREYGDGDSIPYAINLMIDYSGSMKSVMDAIYEGTELFIGLKQPQDLISISTFNKDYEVKVPFATNRQSLMTTFRNKRESGFGMYSALYDGLLKSIRLFDTLPTNIPRVLVAFSDGDDNFSRTKAKQIFKEAIEKKISIFTIGFGYTRDEVLASVAENTGGKYYQVYSKAELISVFLEIYRSLRNYYLVSYKPPTFAGMHYVSLGLNLKSTDTMIAKTRYDQSDIKMWDDSTLAFYKKIPFEYNKAEIRPEAESVIEELAEQMLRYEKVWLEVQGHTDNIGGEQYNQRLSEQRAQAVVNAIIRKGVSEKRLFPVGKGMLFPRTTNDTEEGRAENRRTEFRVLRR